MDYKSLANKYRPSVIKTLLVGEAPPPAGKSYFYLPCQMSRASLENDTSLPATIFGHYFGRKPDDQEEYVTYLESLKEMGIFLIDIVERAIQIRDRKSPTGINEENLVMLIDTIPTLKRRITQKGIDVDEGNIIFLLPRNHYRKQLKTHFPNSTLVRWKEFRMSHSS
ncbi:hypothetical protein [Reichenbachiella sp.]|uniref:hypothetical protein n=1 Tax=Reichenbachiella sp. TaxID=2184521 RepID=UPI003B594D17